MVKVDDHPCYMQLMHVDFKMYKLEVRLLEVDKDAFDPTDMKSC